MLIDTFIEDSLFHHHFQPIIAVEHNIKIGYEVLLRSSVFPNPECTFIEAKKANKLHELDRKSITKALDTYRHLSASEENFNLFLNVFPSTIVRPDFQDFLQQRLEEHQIHPEKIVLEISESELVEDTDDLIEVSNQLKQKGFSIALDDVGKGYANFDMMIKLDLDYIKLDRLFSTKLDQSTKKQQLIHFFLQYCKTNNVQLILEGLETEAEFETARALGISYAQGFFLGRPKPVTHWSV
ncbi:EAL domain-containing protein [Paraliobacillus ryukyuensis]|uniref:EAL domain-containing protein n=1 Tax=Paraliobacillus ryukyuensis TaxID=200904 RepID=UPI0009A77246|nr:EAL domain-containing protein [Paraliobacillus ryukyuensis]